MNAGAATRPDGDTWERVAKNMLRAELIRRGLSYGDLAESLYAIGVQDTEANLRNKISRGRFTTIFFLQCLMALGVDWLRLPELGEMERAAGEHGGQAIAAGLDRRGQERRPSRRFGPPR